MDQALGALYDEAPERRGTLGGSAPGVARWLGDIRAYFPTPVVQVMQQDAMQRLGIERLLLEPEILGAAVPDVHLVATLLTLSRAIPKKTRETARAVVKKVVEDVERRLRGALVQGVRAATRRASRTHRPRANEIDWDRTIRRNLVSTVPLDLGGGRSRPVPVPARLVGWRARTASLHDVILVVDQSGSMATSVVYAGILGSVMASVRAVNVRFLAFDTSVVDLSEHLADPVSLLFGTQLGGGTDIRQALAHARALVRRPERTVVVLISDLVEGGDPMPMLAEARALVGTGAKMVALLALSDEGRPAFDQDNAERLAALRVPSFAVTPDRFAALMAAALEGRDLSAWAASENAERG
ncbi:MAG: VWA domain-containing protein [Deltaproteobacteria bacterium]|nr:VWA domain-containing protein [Deltaproteobacteria bacterium]